MYVFIINDGAGSNRVEHTKNHNAVLPLYIFVCGLMDSNSIWLRNVPFRTLGGGYITGQGCQKLIVQFPYFSPCRPVWDYHGRPQLSRQNVVPENNIHQYWRDQFQLLSTICVSSHCHACLCLVLSLAS